MPMLLARLRKEELENNQKKNDADQPKESTAFSSEHKKKWQNKDRGNKSGFKKKGKC